MLSKCSFCEYYQLCDDGTYRCQNYGYHCPQSSITAFSDYLYQDDSCCPTCGSSNTVYYKNSRKHHYCNDCGTRW